jgi:hypothetical protein
MPFGVLSAMTRYSLPTSRDASYCLFLMYTAKRIAGVLALFVSQSNSGNLRLISHVASSRAASACATAPSHIVD